MRERERERREMERKRGLAILRTICNWITQMCAELHNNEGRD